MAAHSLYIQILVFEGNLDVSVARAVGCDTALEKLRDNDAMGFVHSICPVALSVRGTLAVTRAVRFEGWSRGSLCEVLGALDVEIYSDDQQPPPSQSRRSSSNRNSIQHAHSQRSNLSRPSRIP